MEKLDIVNALSALAQTSRLDILEFLMQAGPAGRPAGQIAEALDIPAATLSFHLKTLRQAALIECQRYGRLLVYRVDSTRIGALLEALAEQCGQSQPAARRSSGGESRRAAGSQAVGEVLQS